MNLPVILTQGEDGFLVAECPVIPGCVSQGRNRSETLRNIREAIELCLESRKDEGWELPSRYEVAQVKVAQPKTVRRSGRRRPVPRVSAGGTR